MLARGSVTVARRLLNSCRACSRWPCRCRLGGTWTDGWFDAPDIANKLQSKLTGIAILSSLIGVLWTMLLFSSSVRPKIVHFSQAAAGALLVTHAIILFLASSWVLAVLVTMIGQ